MENETIHHERSVACWDMENVSDQKCKMNVFTRRNVLVNWNSSFSQLLEIVPSQSEHGLYTLRPYVDLEPCSDQWDWRKTLLFSTQILVTITTVIYYEWVMACYKSCLIGPYYMCTTWPAWLSTSTYNQLCCSILLCSLIMEVTVKNCKWLPCMFPMKIAPYVWL